MYREDGYQLTTVMDDVQEKRAFTYPLTEYPFARRDEHERTGRHFGGHDIKHGAPVNYSLKISPKRYEQNETTTHNWSTAPSPSFKTTIRYPHLELTGGALENLERSLESLSSLCCSSERSLPIERYLDEDASTSHADIARSETSYDSPCLSITPPIEYLSAAMSTPLAIWSHSPSSCGSQASRLKGKAQKLRVRFSGMGSNSSPLEEQKCNSKWVCTFCQKRSTGQWEWERHESTHAPPAIRWICMPDGQAVQNDKCLFCGQESPDEAHMQRHCIHECLNLPLEDRTFARKDHLKSHMARVHKGEAYAVRSLMWQCSDEIHSVLPNWSRRTASSEYDGSMLWCGFCCTSMPDWTARLEHVARHLRRGQHVPTWHPYPSELFDMDQYDEDPQDFAYLHEKELQSETRLDALSNDDQFRHSPLLSRTYRNTGNKCSEQPFFSGQELQSGRLRSTSATANVKLYAEDIQRKRSACYFSDSGRRVFSG